MELNMFSIHSLSFSNHVILDRVAVDLESVGGSTRQPISFGGISREPGENPQRLSHWMGILELWGSNAIHCAIHFWHFLGSVIKHIIKQFDWIANNQTLLHKSSDIHI